MKDYRIKDPNIRREYLLRYFIWSLKMYDCDPSMYLMNYIHKRMELNIEQRYWIAWLYGNTYHLPTAWVIANEFPDFERVDYDRLKQWNDANYKRLRYQSDQKWQKGHLPEMFASYKKEIGHRTQKEFFESICNSESANDNFDSLNKYIIKNFYKFGRYSAWFYIQTLKETCGLNVEPRTLLLQDENAHAQRDGLCYAMALDELVGDKNLRKDAYAITMMNEFAKDIIKTVKTLHPELRCDNFLLETCLCAFKKTFRKKKGRYLGYYLDRQSEDIQIVENDGWHGIDWQLLWDGRNEILDARTINTTVSEAAMSYFLDTGDIKYINFINNNPHMKKIFFTIGTNASGKSSIAKQFLTDPDSFIIDFPDYKNIATVCKTNNVIIIGKYSKKGTSGGCDGIPKKAFIQDMLRSVWDMPQDIFMEGYIIGSRRWITELENEINKDKTREVYFVTLNTTLDTCFARIFNRSGKTRDKLRGNGANVVSSHEHVIKNKAWVAENLPSVKHLELDAERKLPSELCQQLMSA